MRVVFAGTGAFGIPALRELVTGGLAPSLVISQPDRPKGRRGSATPPPLAEAAKELGLPLYQPPRINRAEARARLEEEAPDVLVVVAYGQILRPSVLGIPLLGCVNVHGSLLPRHRGASPIQASILAGDEETGVTVMMMDEGLDSGPILLQESMVLSGDETGGSLHDRLAALGGPLLLRALRGLEVGDLEARPQDDARATVCGLLGKDDGRLDWNQPATVLERRVRAFDPWPGSYTEVSVRGNPLRLGVDAVEVVPEASGSPGTLLEASGERLVIAAQDGGLRLLRVTPAGKRLQDAAAFLRGYQLP